ncbi:hypothetical protein ACFR97_11460 [Haloplanus litoreus]|uniref:Zinc-ribbon domain-containing protein n=1 Tax=Haloplanus litoreus TaxID=767515 RepID=A0ABD5ZXG9_9EURY
MTTRRWDNWWSNYYIALGILSVVAAGYLGWMLSRQPVGVGIGGSIGLVVGIYGVAGLLNVGIGLWIRRGSAYAWYVGMGLLVLSVVGSVASGAGQGVGGVAVSGVGLALGYLARDRMLESKSVTTETGRTSHSATPEGGARTDRQEGATRQRQGERRADSDRERNERPRQAPGTAAADAGTTPSNTADSESRSGAEETPVVGAAGTGGDGRPSTGRSEGEGASSSTSDDDTKFCPYCGEEIPEKASHCPYCSSSIR